MSLWIAIETLSQGNLIVHRDVYYAIINERLSFCRYDRESNTILYSEIIQTPISLLAETFDTFVPTVGTNVFRRPIVPEFYIIEQGTLYDFSNLPDILCPNCLSTFNKHTAIIEGKYARCSGCNKRIYRASRFDGVKETAPPKVVEKKEKKEVKPTGPTQQEIVDEILGDPSKRIKRKLKFKV